MMMVRFVLQPALRQLLAVFEVYAISDYFQWVGSIIIVISCLLHFNMRPHYIRVLGFYAVTSILFSLAQKISNFFDNVGVNSIGNVYTLLEAWVFSLLFYYATTSTIFRKGIFISVTFYTIFYLITFLFFDSYSYSFIRFGRDSLMICYALAYFYYLIRKLPEENLLKLPMFWVNSAVMFFFSSTFILSLMADYIVSVLNNDLAGFWAFRNLFRFAFCLVLAYAGWLDWRSIKSKEKRQLNNPVNF